MSNTFHAAAEQLLSAQHPRLPDLSGVLVLIPNRHVIAPMLSALRGLISHPVFIPPRFATLPELADSLGETPTQQADSVRLIELHRFLGRIDWLDEAARWPMAQDMLTLLNELDVALLVPPTDYDDFARQVERAARRALSAPLVLEARLIFDIWRAFQGGSAGGGGEYAWRLGRWLRQAVGPLYALGLGNVNRLEARFLAQCRERGLLQDLPVEPRFPLRRALLANAWQQAEGAQPLRERAVNFAAAVGESPLGQAVWLHGAADLEDEATVVANWIGQQLQAGRRAIGVVALDRLAARRLRAMLDRHGLLLQDETGWTFSTASVSHVLDSWLTLLLDGFYHRDLLDFLKSPFVFADVDAVPRQTAVGALQAAIGADSVVKGLDRFLVLALARASEALPLLQRLEKAAARFGQPRRRTLSSWLHTLFDALDLLGATPAIAADQAGSQLLDWLSHLAGEIDAERGTYRLADWRTWLNLQLDRQTFREFDIDSPLRLTHLAALALREFDALVILGADAAHLPEARDDGFFNDALRAELGLPGRHARSAEKRHDLIEAMCRADQVLITWQVQRAGNPNPPSPWLTLLDSFHRLAYQQSLVLNVPLGPLASPDDNTSDTRTRLPAPTLPDLPTRLSASAWQELVSCPYRWFARRGLGLAKEDEVAEEMEKAEYGELVHAILAEFHGRHPALMTVARDALEASLAGISQTHFAPREVRLYLARGWRMRWQRQQKAYLDWALDWEAAGHHWLEAEKAYVHELALAEARCVTLYGRLDRVDAGPAGAAVLDYKTQAKQALTKKGSDPSEHVQLPFYGLLTGAPEAVLVGLDDEKVTTVSLRQSLPEAAAAERARLVATLDAIAAGAALPAHGAAEVCAHCEMRGLCRRDWHATLLPG